MPMLMPYFDSGQIISMVSGTNGGAILEKELSGDTLISTRWRAYQAGLVLLMAVMVIGAIYGGSQQHEDGEAL
jgi:hypothetical protein